MAKIEVVMQGGLRRIVDLDLKATSGATIGKDVFNPGGSLFVPAQQTPGPPIAGGGGGGGGGGPPVSISDWALLMNIPQNIVDLAALTGGGFAWRDPDDGHWELRRSGRAVIPFAFGDATPESVYIPSEAGVVVTARIAVDVAFNGTGAALSIGSIGSPGLYLPASDVNPAVVASYESVPDLPVGAGDDIMLYITPGSGASTGSGRVIIDMIPTAES